MIPLVSPTITPYDRNQLAAFAWSDGLTDERTVRRFEEAFAERVGCAGAVAVCSGTAALTLTIQVLRAKTLIIPTYACSAIWNARVHGEEASLADGNFVIRTATMWSEPVAVLVHAFGTRTQSIVGPIEDWTLSLGGVPELTGRVGVCSTHASKMLSTGRGGIVFSNDEELLDEVRALAYYDSTPNGTLGAHSLGMSSLQAALGLSQLAQLDEFIERRREIAFAYADKFCYAGMDEQRYPDPNCGSVFFRYLISVDDPAAKVAALAEHGIEAGRGVYPPLHQQLGLPDTDFPGATECVNRLLSVPCHPSLSDKQVRYVAEKVLQVCA